MAKFNGKVTLTEFKRNAVQVVVFGAHEDDTQWQTALAKARTWRRAAAVLPRLHPMIAIAMGEEF